MDKSLNPSKAKTYDALRRTLDIIERMAARNASANRALSSADRILNKLPDSASVLPEVPLQERSPVVDDSANNPEFRPIPLGMAGVPPMDDDALDNALGIEEDVRMMDERTRLRNTDMAGSIGT